jgi:type IV pilus assembly PilW-like protein
MRGVVATSVYQVNYSDSTVFIAPKPGNPDRGTIILTDPGPTGVHQDLTPYQDLFTNPAKPVHEALIMVSPTGDQTYAVVEIESGNVVINRDGAGNVISGNATLNFVWTGDTYADTYKTLYNSAGGFPLTRVAAVGILEEWRFYVRDTPQPAGAIGSASSPVLSMARVVPGREEAYRGDTDNLKIDVADGIVDLQVALGIDANGDGVIASPGVGGVTPTNDEWQYDDPADGVLTGTLKYIRVSAVVRTQRPDQGYTAPPLAPLEDHDYDNPPSALNLAGGPDRHYRRRLLQTVVDLRNLG